MSALQFAYPDSEGSVRSWLRELDLAGVGARWFFGVPAKPTFPLGLITRVAGGPLRGVPVDRPIMQLDLLGATPTPGQPPSDKYVLAAIATALVGAAESLAAGTVVSPGVVCLGAEVENGPVWAPDRGDSRGGQKLDGRARYTTDVAFLLRLA
jgi:hypothetical protein